MLLRYVARRVLMMIPTLLVISLVAFVLIQLPPGDFLDSYIATLESDGGAVNQQEVERLRDRYGLDDPLLLQYWKWLSGILFHGDFGWSFQYQRPVAELLWERVGMTFVLAFLSMILVYVIAFPIGIYSAVKKYTIGDYTFTFLGFLGLATPNFLLALVLMYVSLIAFGQSVGGLFSPEFANAPWSWARFWDLLAHIWIPVVIIGTASTAGLIRIMRANLLDELSRPYVETARAKGLSETRLLLRYPVRLALNPFVSQVGWELPNLVSGAAITAIVLNLPTTGPMLLLALKSQDMYLAGSFVMILSVLTVIGTLQPGAPFYLLGADRLGRDLLSRLIHGARVSMSIGLVGVAVSLVLGTVLGGVSGYYGGWVDHLVQRSIEFIKAMPTIPLWMALAAAIPQYWSPLGVYFVITVIVSLIGWTSLAREVRGRFMSMRTEDFVAAAKLDGAGEMRIILRHMAPSFLSHLVATLALAIPAMILAETALSFLGIGLRPPVVSWGVLLQDAQNVRAVATAPWLLWPAAAVVVAVLSLNFLGDGLRDAADPYAS